MRNDTENPSSIRLGGYNSKAIKYNHHLHFINTITSSEWKLPLYQLDFVSSHLIQEPAAALINPGYPFIAAPFAEFEKFKGDL